MPDAVDNYEDLPQLRHPAGYVYVIRDVEISGCYKIGFTSHPLTRFDVFERELPFSIKPVLIIKSQDAEGDERRLHRDYDRYRKYGEWFKLDDSHLARIRSMSQPSIVFVASADFTPPPQARRSPREVKSVASQDYQNFPNSSGTSFVYVIQETYTRLFRIMWADEPKRINWFGVKIPIRTEVVIVEQVDGFSSSLAGDLNRQFKQHRRVGYWLDLNDLELLELHLALAPPRRRVSAPTAITPTPKPALQVPPGRRVTRAISPRSQRQVQNVPTIQSQARTSSVSGWRNLFRILIVLAVIYFVILIMLAVIYFGVSQNGLDSIVSLILPPPATSTPRPTATSTPRPTATSTPQPTATSSPQPSATSTLQPSATSTLQPTATPTRHPTTPPTATFTATTAPSPTATEIALYFVDAASAYVRACPSTNCRAVGGLSAGDSIQVHGQVSGEQPPGFGSDMWSLIEFKGDVAYIHSALLSKDDPLSDY